MTDKERNISLFIFFKYIFILSYSKLFGKIKIGDNVAIGANAVVNKSFGDNGTCILPYEYPIVEAWRSNSK